MRTFFRSIWLAGILLCVLLPAEAAALPQTRSDCVSVVYHGTLMRTPVREECFGQLLDRLGLPVAEEDTLSHDLTTVIEPDMTLRVDRILTREEIYTVAIPYETQTCRSDQLPEGSWEILISGQEGELQCRAEVTYINGKELERKVLSETQRRAPVTEVVAMGTGPVPEISNQETGLPVIGDGYIRLSTGEVLTYTDTATVRASAYTHTDEGCDLITATGSRVHVGTVAVDPRYIPYGTRMFIMARSGSYVYGVSQAEDCGGAIKGDRVDLYLPTYEQCMEFGRRVCTVYFLG